MMYCLILLYDMNRVIEDIIFSEPVLIHEWNEKIWYEAVKSWCFGNIIIDFIILSVKDGDRYQNYKVGYSRRDKQRLIMQISVFYAHTLTRRFLYHMLCSWQVVDTFTCLRIFIQILLINND